MLRRSLGVGGCFLWLLKKLVLPEGGSFGLIVNVATHMVVPMKPFRFDRSVFNMGSHGQNAQRNAKYWSKRPVEDRLAAAAYLNSIAYGYPQHSPPPTR